jgi:phosphatidate cytidylyltransferase
VQQRLISAAVFVPVVVIAFLLGPYWLGFGIAALCVLAAYETSRLVRGAGLGSETWFAMAAAAVAGVGILFLFPNSFFGPPGYVLAAQALTFAAAVVIGAAMLALRHPDPRDGFRWWTGTVIAALYPSLLAMLTGILFAAPAIPGNAPLAGILDPGRVWILILVMTVWSFDSFAYVAGKFHGRGRFMNHISPNKTWSGVFGGTAASVVVCTLFVFAAGQSALAGILLGLAIAVTAQAGDLAESVLKRAAGAKDSSNLIPGHGGILDRIDSFLFAAPAMFFALTWARSFVQP